MARLRVLGENPPPPRGNGENQLRELRDYLTRLKDELEFLMTHLGEDNFAESLATWVTDTSKSVESINASIDDINGEIGDINTALAGKQDTLTFDDTPTSGSDNPVKSGGVYSALSGKQNTLTFDNAPASGSANPVKSSGIYDALQQRPKRNLFRNWCFIGGGTGRGVLPVNQRGNSSYARSDNGWSIDGWQFNAYTYGILTIEAGDIKIVKNGATSNPGIRQDIEEDLDGNVVTFSIWTTDGVDSKTSPVLSKAVSGWQDYQTFFDGAIWYGLRFIDGHWSATRASPGASIFAVKLEIGTASTLTRDVGGVVMLNDVADYEAELIRCLTCNATANDSYANKTIVTQ